MSRSDVSMVLKGKVFHEVVLVWYDIVKWMVGPGCSL